MAIPLATVFYGGWAIGNGFGNVIGGYLGDVLEEKYRTGRVTLIIIGVLGGMISLIYVISLDLPPINYEFTGLSSIIGFLSFLFHHPAYGIPFDIFVLGGVFASFSYPNMYTMVENINVPEVRGTMTALNQATDQMGRGLGPVVGGFLAGVFGSLRVALIIGALFWIPCALLFIPLYKTKVRDEDWLRDELKEKRKEMEKLTREQEKNPPS